MAGRSGSEAVQSRLLRVSDRGESQRSRRAQPVVLVGIISVSLCLAGCGFGSGTTAADKLVVGDCFVLPAETEFTSVEDQDCAEPHEVEVFAEVRLDVFGDLSDIETIDDLKELENLDVDDLPIGVNAGGAPPVELEDACFEKLLELTEIESLPEDATVSLVSTTVSQTSGQCAIISPSAGLVGSIAG